MSTKQYPLDKIIPFLKKKLDPARFKHTLGTTRIAMQLAAIYNAPVLKAEAAGLLHDCGKSMSARKMINYVKARRVSLPNKAEVIENSPALLHSFIGADIARRIFGIKDQDILAAVRNHTVGAPDMGLLSKIIYISDAVAFDRRYPGIKRVRRLAYRNMDAAIREVMANKLYYVVLKKKWLHPGAAAAWNSAIRRERE